MTNTLISEALSGAYHSGYEQIIEDLIHQHYAVVEDFFEASLIGQLHAELHFLHDHDKLKKAAIGKHFDEHIVKDIRGDYIQWIEEKLANPTEKAFFDAVNDFTDYLNRTCFMGILHKEFHYAVYPEGRFYKRHLDTFENDQRRKLSMVLYLNKAWTEDNGGELVIYKNEGPEEKSIPILPKFGRVVIFESSVLEHEVKPVLKGERLSITGWLKVR
jgi:SM-20-related protein